MPPPTCPGEAERGFRGSFPWVGWRTRGDSPPPWASSGSPEPGEAERLPCPSLPSGLPRAMSKHQVAAESRVWACAAVHLAKQLGAQGLWLGLAPLPADLLGTRGVRSGALLATHIPSTELPMPGLGWGRREAWALHPGNVGVGVWRSLRRWGKGGRCG